MTLTHSGRPAPTADRAANHTYPSLYDTAQGYHRASYEAGWRDGSFAAVSWAAERADALDESWRPLTRRAREEVRQARLDSLAPTEGVDEWLEVMRQKTLKSMGFVCSPDRLTAALAAEGVKVSPVADCEWPPVAVPVEVSP